MPPDLKATGEDSFDHLRNVIAVDHDGTVRWKLPERPRDEPRSYTNVFTKDGSDLWAHNFSGMLYRVAPDTGEIVEREFVK